VSAPSPSPNWYAVAAEVTSKARTHWVSIFTLTVLGGAVALGTALVLPAYYSANAAFQAESAVPSALSGSLAGLAAQFGAVQLSGQSNPELFADLLTTDAILRRVARARFPWKGDTVTLAAVYGYAKEAPGWRDFHTVRKLRKRIAVDISVRTGVVRFSVEARTAKLAVALVDTLLAALDEANIALRQTRASAERNFTAARAEHAREELAVAESTLARFSERNRVIANSPSLQLVEGRLRRSVDMAQQVYVELRLQEEQAAVQAVRNTPAISVIDPPIEPVKPSWPRKRLAVGAGLVCGLALALARLTLQPREA
jgi:uncharacterized protein involved in exopolysaccharide biosynthesis